MIGMIISAHCKCTNPTDVSTPAIGMQYFYFCLLASVYTIHQSMTCYTLMIIFRHHVIDLIYGNCFVCMLNNAWHVQLMFWKINLSSFSFSIFINTFTMFFPLTLHLFVVFYRVDGLYKMMRGKLEGEMRIYIEGHFWGPKVPHWSDKWNNKCWFVAVTRWAGWGVAVHHGQGYVQFPSKE